MRQTPSGASGKRRTTFASDSPLTMVSSPNVGSDSNVLNAVDAVSATDIWAVGSYFTVGDEVYLFAEGGSSFDQVLGILTEGHLYPAIGTLASLPDGYRPIDEGAAVDQDVLRRLAEGTRYLIVGAYDAEGWLIWSRYP